MLILALFVAALGARAASVGSPQAEVSNPPELDDGFHLLYELKRSSPRSVCHLAYGPSGRPLGSGSEAASFQGVLTSEYFFDNQRFLGKDSDQAGPGDSQGILRRGPPSALIWPVFDWRQTRMT